LPPGVVVTPRRKHPRIPVCGGASPNAATGTPVGWIRIYSCIGVVIS
jgi:hypothetical protein